MEIAYTFSVVSAIVGLVIMALGALVVKYYNKLADVTSFSNYSRWQLIGFITIGIGFLVMLNVHEFLLKLLVSSIMSGGF
jgi:hypothetical protein